MNNDSLIAAAKQYITVDYLSTLTDADGLTEELVGKMFTLESITAHAKLKNFNDEPKLMAKVRREGKVNEWFADSLLTKFTVGSCDPGIELAEGLTYGDVFALGKVILRFEVTGSTPAFDRMGNPMYRRDCISAVKTQKLLKGDYEAFRSREISPERTEARRAVQANIEDLFLDSLCKGGRLTPENEIKYRVVNPIMRVCELLLIPS